MEMPLQVNTLRPPRNDGQILTLMVMPAAVVAGLLVVAGMPDVALIVLALAGALATIVCPDIGLYGYFALQALDQVMLQEEGSIITPVKLVGPFVLLAFAVNPSRTRIPILANRQFVAAMLLFGVFGIVTAIWAIAPLAALRYGAQIVVQVLLIVVAVQRLSDREAIARAGYFLLLGALIATGILLLYGSRSESFSGATLGEKANPNSTAAALSIPLACIPIIWTYTRSKVIRLLVIATGPPILTAMMTTGSRSALVAVVAAGPLGLMMVRRAGFTRRVVVPLVSLLLAGGTALLVLESGMLGERVHARLAALVSEGVDIKEESRWAIWGLALKTFAYHPWGFGYGNTQFALAEEHGFNIDAHSTLISSLVDGGVISFGLFTWGLLALWLNLRRLDNPAHSIPGMILFMFIILSTLTHTIHFSKYFWVPMTFAVLVAEQGRREELEEELTHRQPQRPPDTQDLLRNLGPADAVVY